MYKALTIAGSDSGGGAGIQADLKTFMAHSIYAASAVTAITAQNTLGIQRLTYLSPSLVEAQINSVLSDIRPHAVKTGMLGTTEIIQVVVSQLQAFGIQQVVVDPVMVSTSGTRLLSEDAVIALQTLLLPLALIVTPNLPEASVLTGHSIDNEQDMEVAVQEIWALGSRYVLLKGGHLAGDPVDILYDGHQMMKLRVSRIDTPHTHGTGCTYSAAITAVLAKGNSVEQAVIQAKSYLHCALEHAVAVGTGCSPIHHFYNLEEEIVTEQRGIR